MGAIKDVSKYINIATYGLHEAAFGDIRNLFSDDELYHFMMSPIGLYLNSHDILLHHLSRNIGNIQHSYDGYGTPIGMLAEPFYNSIVKPAWFFTDELKNSTANYLEYIRSVYGATLSVENLNNNFQFHLIDDATKVGSISGIRAIDVLLNNSTLLPNPNETGFDTLIGVNGGYFNRETLDNAVVANDERAKHGFSITAGMKGKVGINTENITVEKTYSKVSDPNNGRYADGVFSPLTDYTNPIDSSNYGTYSDMGSYSDFYESLSKKTKEFFDNNFKPKVYNNWIDSYGLNDEKNRYEFKTFKSNSNINDSKNGGVYVYTEKEHGSSTDITYASFNSGTKFSRYTSYKEGLKVNDLLKKTNDNFKKSNYKTIIARFHTDPQETTDTTQTAISKKYGMSHGRNLLKREADYSEGYENPYCRVWTFHHQYKSLKDTIRPFDELDNDEYFSAFTADNSERGFENGRERLRKYGSINRKNGLVNITPIDSSDESKKVDIKNCMFSIENLAWKDAFSTDQKSRETFQAGGLSAEQKGPFGGRIMWFPPYDLKFNEDVNVNWNETNFIGRGEGIYTYTNTTRTGSLSFKILVDHPSIIDYWENRGKSVSNSVDSIDDPEQELLRFFAGCDILTSTPPSIKEDKQSVIYDEPIHGPSTDAIKFFVFFPNNYSGINDDTDFAIKYLANGLGAGKEKIKNYVDGECYTSEEVTDYKIPFANSSVFAKNMTSTKFGGYEMRAGYPISLRATQNDEGFIQMVKVGEGTGRQCDDGKMSLYTQDGEGGTEWWKRRWYYRVDKEYINQDLLQTNYLDLDSYGLNSKQGKSSVIETHSVKDGTKLYSFADVFVATEGGYASSVIGEELYDAANAKNLRDSIDKFGIDHIECIGWASKQGHSNLNKDLSLNRAKVIAKWLSSKDIFKNAKIVPTAGGTEGKDIGVNNGDESSLLNKAWRCVEVNIYLKSETSKTIQESVSEEYTKPNGYDSATHLTNIKGSPLLDSSKYSGVDRIKYITDLSANKMVEYEMVKDTERSIKLMHLNENLNNLAFNLNDSIKNRNVNVNSIFSAISEFSEHEKYLQYNELGFVRNRGVMLDNYGYSRGGNDIIDFMHDNASNLLGKGLKSTLEDSVDTYETREGTKFNKPARYDNEATFFSMLEKEEPFLHHKISDKVKYFDPAFHSISPEGFNARLTFLHQCTRQGPTVGASDNYTANNTANNLAFGRPPVCILRIGDFYYTKILIDNIAITFDPLVWDLNAEGIGVMPMIADINIRFKFIGGSSLAGHIARLQNAISFNYYANTEVYDNRSELAEYDENGNISRLAPYNPIKK